MAIGPDRRSSGRGMSMCPVAGTAVSTCAPFRPARADTTRRSDGRDRPITNEGPTFLFRVPSVGSDGCRTARGPPQPWVTSSAEGEAHEPRDARLAGQRDESMECRGRQLRKQARGTHQVTGGCARERVQERIQLAIRDAVQHVEEPADIAAVHAHHDLDRPVESMGELHEALEPAQQLPDAGVVVRFAARVGEARIQEWQYRIGLALQAGRGHTPEPLPVVTHGQPCGTGRSAAATPSGQGARSMIPQASQSAMAVRVAR